VADSAGNQLQVKQSFPIEVLEVVCSFMFFSNKEPCGFRSTLFCVLGYTRSQADTQEQAEAGAAAPAPLFGS
jgi:hypothetical protein